MGITSLAMDSPIFSEQVQVVHVQNDPTTGTTTEKYGRVLY